MDDLDVVVPPLCATAGGIEVRPLVVRQLSPFAKALKKLPDDVIAGLSTGSINPLAIAEHCDVFAEAVAIATFTDVKTIGDMLPDRLVNLVGAVLEVNLDFFVRHLAPALNDRMGRVTARGQRLIAVAGSMSSSGSSSMDTSDPTSSTTR